MVDIGRGLEMLGRATPSIRQNITTGINAYATLENLSLARKTFEENKKLKDVQRKAAEIELREAESKEALLNQVVTVEEFMLEPTIAALPQEVKEKIVGTLYGDKKELTKREIKNGMLAMSEKQELMKPFYEAIKLDLIKKAETARQDYEEAATKLPEGDSSRQKKKQVMIEANKKARQAITTVKMMQDRYQALEQSKIDYEEAVKVAEEKLKLKQKYAPTGGGKAAKPGTLEYDLLMFRKEFIEKYGREPTRREYQKAMSEFKTAEKGEQAPKEMTVKEIDSALRPWLTMQQRLEGGDTFERALAEAVGLDSPFAKGLMSRI